MSSSLKPIQDALDRCDYRAGLFENMTYTQLVEALIDTRGQLAHARELARRGVAEPNKDPSV